MRRFGGKVLMLVMLLCTSSGCGTMFNVTGHEVMLLGPREQPIVPFGGVANDVQWMSRGPGAVIPAALDMPLSLVGDIVTLPWTIYQSSIAVRPRVEQAPLTSR